MNAANPTFTIEGNTISYNNGVDSAPGNTDDAGFRSGLSADEAGGTFANNTAQTINHDAIIRFASAGAINVSNNNLNGGGLEFVDFNAGAGTLTVNDNIFNGAFSNTYSNALRLKNNTNAITTIVSGNTFTGFVGNVTGYGATLSMENYQAVSITNNTFTPLANSTTYRHISVNTKDFSSSSGYFAPVVDANITKNTFNGSGAVGGMAIGFYNWDNDNPTFNTFTIGTAGNENTFASDIATYIHLDNSIGTVNPNGTTRALWTTNLNIANNQFASALPANMTKAQLFSVEDKVVHSLDVVGLGLVTWVANNNYVTTNTLGIQRGVDAASAGFTVNVDAGSYNESVSLNKTLTILGPNAAVSPNTGTRVAEAILVNAVNGRTFLISSGNTNVSISGFKFDGGSPIHDGNGGGALNSSDVTFSNNLVVNANAIYAGATTSWADLVITDNKFEDINATSTASAMQVSHTTSTTVTDNTFINVNYAAMVIDTTPVVNIANNTINGTGAQGIQLAGAIGNATIEKNKIANANTGQAVDKGAIRLYGADFTGAVLISNNEITGGFNGIAVKDGQNITGKNIIITENSITGLVGGKAIYHGGIGVLNAICNWFGTATQADVASAISGNVTYLPYLSGGTDDGDTTNGFQPQDACIGGFTVSVFSDDAETSLVQKHQTIQGAIDAASTLSGYVVRAEAGTYTENINISKSIKLRGAQKGIDPRPSATSARTIDGTDETILQGSGGQPVVIITSGGVEIDGFEFKHTSASPSGDLVQSNALGLDGIIFKNNIVKDATDEGIQLRNFDNAVVSFNYFIGVKGDAVNMSGNPNGFGSKIEDNEIANTGSPYGAIYLYSVKDIQVKRNYIYGNTSGISVGTAGEPVENITVSENRINSNFLPYAARVAGIYIYDNNTKNIVIENNEIIQTGSTPATPSVFRMIWIDNNPQNISIHNNYLKRDVAENYIYVNSTVTNDVDATCNWYNTTDSAQIAARIGGTGSISYLPFLNNGTDDNVADTGFTPLAGACVGCPSGNIVTNTTTSKVFCTIQDAIDDPTTVSGHSIAVGAGTYNESIYIYKDDITITGPNVGKTGNDITRVAEAIVVPTEWYGIYTDAEKVTIDGMTVDGSNASDYGIYSTNTDGKGEQIIQNNVVKNFSTMGFLGNVPSGPSSSNNLVTRNLFHDIAGRSIVALNNYYANVSYNMIYNTSIGLYAENANKPEVSGTVEWKNNTISASRSGIWYNLAYGTATPLTIKDNIINVENDLAGTRWDGIWLTSLGGSLNPIITNNTIVGGSVTQQTNGYNLWNNNTTATNGIIIDGGAVSDVGYGVWINNWEGYPTSTGSLAKSTKALVQNVSISNASIAGIYIHDNPLNTNGVTGFVNATILNNSIDNTDKAVLIVGNDATAKVNNNSLTNNTTNAIANNSPTVIDATCNWFGTSDQLVIDAKIAGSVNFLPYLLQDAGGSTYSWSGSDTYSCTGFGPVLVYDNDPLTTGVLQSSHLTVQSAIDAVTTINNYFITVSPGSYTENVTVSKSLTIRGANTGKNPNTVTRTAESRLLDGTITISGANTVVLDGFEVYQTDAATAITVAGESAVTLENTILNRQGAVLGNAGTAVKILAGTGVKSISANMFIGSYNTNAASSRTWFLAIDVKGSTGNNITITNNVLEKSYKALNVDDMSTGIDLLGNKFITGNTWMSFGGSSPTVGLFTFGANDFGFSGGDFIDLINVDPSFRLDISAGSYNNQSFSSISLYNSFVIEAKIKHRLRNGRNGLVYLVPNTQYVSYNSIQDAINYAPSAGETINIRAGNYLTEQLLINKSLTLKGPNYNIACGASRLASTEANIISNNSLAPITIAADNVTINGLGIKGTKAFNAINVGSSSNTTIAFNNIREIGTDNSASGSNVHAILYTLGAANTTDVTIVNNCIDNIGRSSLSGYSASAIGVIESTSSGVLENLSIKNNAISNVKVNTAPWPAGKVTYGILTNVGGNSSFASNTGNVKNSNISFNTISGLSGHIATGIALEGNTETAIVERNTVSNLTSTKTANRAGGGYDSNGLKFENNKYVNTVTVQNNSFDVGTSGYAVANYVPTAIGGTATLTCNWFGSNDYGVLEMNYNAATPVGKIFNKEGAGTTFIPYLSNAIIDPTEVGYTCSSSFAMPNTLDVTYTAASDNIVVNFELSNNSVAAYPIPGLNPPTPANLNVMAAKYTALKDAIDMGTAEELKAAAFALGDDIITEYYYMDGPNKVYLKTAGNSDLIKSKYWDQYLVNSGTTVRYPNFGSSLFIAPEGSYVTSTNPLTGLVPNGWLVPVYGKDLYVRITVVNNGNVSVATKTVPIDAVPVSPAYSGTSIITSLEAATATASKADAYLNIVSNNLGVVITRINGTASVINPVEGMIIYDTSDNTFKVNTTGTVSGWRPFAN